MLSVYQLFAMKNTKRLCGTFHQLCGLWLSRRDPLLMRCWSRLRKYWYVLLFFSEQNKQTEGDFFCLPPPFSLLPYAEGQNLFTSQAPGLLWVRHFCTTGPSRCLRSREIFLGPKPERRSQTGWSFSRPPPRCLCISSACTCCLEIVVRKREWFSQVCWLKLFRHKDDPGVSNWMRGGCVLWSQVFIAPKLVTFFSQSVNVCF